MKVRLTIIEDIGESSVNITVPKKTKYIDNLFEQIRSVVDHSNFYVKKNDEYVSVSTLDIERIYTERNSIFCEVNGERFKIRERIYEMLNLLPKDIFIQISQSEIVNRKYIKKFCLSPDGLYEVILKNETKTYASRRFMYKIKKEYIQHESF
ncbi:LytTR family DNA-binding domain-containing protein [Periweissella beninensis]|uniref:LytTR family DNA-binding domain-containing protein n=1 Tax=Periweissella beninensis TaxID=504936 RepID=UPI0021A83302|nr:LytTR family DNA-binding domain-containing protein [Periweissella beninensis]MCT4396996.1 LytTR family transcriptional regulator [Periweissella beninensis]